MSTGQYSDNTRLLRPQHVGPGVTKRETATTSQARCIHNNPTRPSRNTYIFRLVHKQQHPQTSQQPTDAHPVDTGTPHGHPAIHNATPPNHDHVYSWLTGTDYPDKHIAAELLKEHPESYWPPDATQCPRVVRRWDIRAPHKLGPRRNHTLVELMQTARCQTRSI